jgi:membrane-associated phospholipid phosphatase
VTTTVVRPGATDHDAVRRAARLALTLAVTFAAVLGLVLVLGLALQPFIHPVGSTTIDRLITDRLLAGRTRLGLDVVGHISLLGGPTLVPPVAATATVLLAWAQRYRLTMCFATTVVGAAALNSLARMISTPRRPPGELGLVHPFFSSFPSGHAAEAAACSLGLAIVVAAVTPRRAVRAVAWSAAVVVMLAVAFSRVYLLVHWTTDVLVGLVIGTLWAFGTARAFHVRPQARPPSSRPARPGAPQR